MHWILFHTASSPSHPWSLWIAFLTFLFPAFWPLRKAWNSPRTAASFGPPQKLSLSICKSDFDDKIFSRKDGYLYSYTGLRGNAKTLYKRIISGAEKRIKLIAAPTYLEQQKYVYAADLVIWSCGYQTNKIQIKNHDGKDLTLS